MDICKKDTPSSMLTPRRIQRIRHIMNYTNNMRVLLQEFKYTQEWLESAPGITNFQALIMVYKHWSYHRRLRHKT